MTPIAITFLDTIQKLYRILSALFIQFLVGKHSCVLYKEPEVQRGQLSYNNEPELEPKDSILILLYKLRKINVPHTYTFFILTDSSTDHV